jgi:hypothetical protein
MRRVILLAAVVLVLAGCSGGGSDTAMTKDLRHYLAFNYEHKAGIADSYSGLGAVTYRHGNVTIDAPAWYDNDYGAYLYCSWVEPWLADNGTDNSRITVRMGGSVVLQTHNMGESCQDASYNATSGG